MQSKKKKKHANSYNQRSLQCHNPLVWACGNKEHSTFSSSNSHHSSFIIQCQYVLDKALNIVQTLSVKQQLSRKCHLCSTKGSQLKDPCFVCHFLFNHVTALTISHFLSKGLHICLAAIVNLVKTCFTDCCVNNIDLNYTAVSNHMQQLVSQSRHTSLQLSITAEKSPMK